MKPNWSLIGERFGRLVVVEELLSRSPSPSEKLRRFWLCQCDCGGQKETYTTALQREPGGVRSCGCIKREQNQKNALLVRKGRASPLYKGEGTLLNSLLDVYRKRALRKGKSFSLTLSRFEQLVKLPCTYCGVPPYNKRVNHTVSEDSLFYNGLDRVDSEKGYEEGNVVPCCPICNRAKADLTLEAFREWVVRLSGWVKDPTVKPSL
jgi:hypothetical protein